MTKQYSIFKGISEKYVNEDPEVACLFEYPYYKEESLFEREKFIEFQKPLIQQDKVMEEVLAFNDALGAGEKTKTHINLLKQGAYAVVTGQQAGIFTGALYTVYKAITAIKLAKRYESLLNKPVVPIFWIASEDHDFQEIRMLKHYANGKLNTYAIDKSTSGKIEKYLPPVLKLDQLKASVGHLKVNQGVEDAISNLLGQAQPDELENLEALLKTTFMKEDSLSNWFGKIMSKLFSDYGLVFIDPMSEAIRGAETSLFKKALSEMTLIQERLESQTKKVREMGFNPSLEYDSNGLNLFYYMEGERLAIKKREAHFYVTAISGEVIFEKAVLEKMMEEEPNRFSTNVILRPVAQDMLFKTLAYVAGPGEISYYTQLKEVYPSFDMKMPIIFPRENFTVLTESVYEKMNDLGIDPQALLIMGAEGVRDRILDLKDDIRIDESFEAYMALVSEGYDQLIHKIETISPDIHEFTEKNKGMILNQIAYLQEKAHRFHRRNHKDLLKQINEIELQIMPEGGLQERTLSVIQYYGKKGSDFIDYLIEEMPLEVSHRIIKL